MAKPKRINHGDLLNDILGNSAVDEETTSIEEAAPEQKPAAIKKELPSDPGVKAEPKKTVGRKAAAEKKQQVSIYLMEDQVIALDDQTGYNKKEREKSALARTGIDIALALSVEQYTELKAIAEQKGTSPGEIMKAAFAAYNK